MTSSAAGRSLGRDEIDRIWTIVPIVVACTLNVLVFGGCRYVNAFMADFSLNTVVQYAQPWVTIAFLMVLGLTAFGSRRCLRSARLSFWTKVSLVLLLDALSLLFTAELGSAVLFSFRDAEIDVVYLAGWFVPRRVVLTEYGDSAHCVRADVSGFYTWRLNGVAVHPRLLLLPLEGLPHPVTEDLEIFKCLAP